MWLEAGQDYELFWRLTPKEITAILSGAAKFRAENHDAERARLNELARLIAFAHHEPAKIPKFKKTTAATVKREVQSPANDLAVRHYFIGLATKGASVK